MNKKAINWQDYSCLYTGDGNKIEKWGEFTLERPDPLAIWAMPKHKETVDAKYLRSSAGGGEWKYLKKLPEEWTINYQELTFKVAPLGFKHTGLFPEQASNWDSIKKLIKENPREEIKVLNLFAYTGAATLMAAYAGADEVVHVDSSKGMVQWAKDNAGLSKLDNHKIRFIVDDCLKFILKEQRRGNKYHGIIMDPPSFGRGPNKEIWKFEEQINNLLVEASKLLADDAIFFLISAYSAGYSSTVIKNLLKENVVSNGPLKKVETGELLIPVLKQGIDLPCGVYGIITND